MGKVLDDSRQPLYRWFVGGEVNTCYNALDLHIEKGRGDQPALIYDSASHRLHQDVHLSRIARQGSCFCGSAGALGCRQRRSRDHLHADGPRGSCGNACVRPPGSSALRCVRRLCCKRTGHAYRRCQAESGRFRLVRCGGEENNSLQTSPRRSTSNCQAQTSRDVCFAARDGARRSRGRSRLRLE